MTVLRSGRRLPGWLVLSVFLLAGLASVQAAPPPLPANPNELPNGLVLPQPWPPRTAQWTNALAPVPYLTNLPAIIPIDIGRQMFVDDYVLGETTLKRTWHAAEWHTNNPVLKVDGGNAAVHGVWYDRTNKLFKLWYSDGGAKGVRYASSTNGLDWEKPALDIIKETNLVLPGENAGTTTVWLDEQETNPERRFKLFQTGAEKRLRIYGSRDGIRWGEPLAVSSPSGDGATAFFNPFRNRWVYQLGTNDATGRVWRYVEGTNALVAARWLDNQPVGWIGADPVDATRSGGRAGLMSLEVFPYENFMLGLFAVSHTPQKNELSLGFSRDGFHWDRSHRLPFIPVETVSGESAGRVKGSPGGCLMVGRRLYFYVPNAAGTGVNLATLRRDGFASMDTATEGTLTTRLLSFTGRRLFLNVDCPNGELRIEVLDELGQVIKLKDQAGKIYPLDVEHSAPMKTDSTLVSANWAGVPDLQALAGRPVRFRFHLKNGSLYSFWTSAAINGASHGFMAAGGPHFSGARDTIGTLSYRPFNGAPATKAPGPIIGPLLPPTPPKPGAK